MRELLREEIVFRLDQQVLLRRLHSRADSVLFQRGLELYETHAALFRPAYALREFAVTARAADGVAVGGCFFQSRILSRQLGESSSAFLYVATCGPAIGQAAAQSTDMLDHFLLDQLAYMSYLAAMEALAADMEPLLGIEKYRLLCPGSIPDWSVAEVPRIFRLLDGLPERLGLRVLDSGMIEPLKSTSGVLYETAEEFESCAICPRIRCESRRVPFDPQQHEAMSSL